MGISMEQSHLARIVKYNLDKIGGIERVKGDIFQDLRKSFAQARSKMAARYSMHRGFAGVAALVGYGLIVHALIVDIDLVGTAYDVLDTVFGGG